MKKVILASNSPRRHELMKLLGVPFEIVASDFDESSIKTKDPKKLVERLSYEKARVVAKRFKNAIVIGGDTVVVLGKKIIGKPKDKRDAEKTLKLLSGTKHTIITGLTVIDVHSGRKITKSAELVVKMKKLTNKEIEAYVKTGEPMGHAGSYAVNERGGIFVKEVSGDFFSAIGLPLRDLREAMIKFEVKTIF